MTWRGTLTGTEAPRSASHGRQGTASPVSPGHQSSRWQDGSGDPGALERKPQHYAKTLQGTSVSFSPLGSACKLPSPSGRTRTRKAGSKDLPEICGCVGPSEIIALESEGPTLTCRRLACSSNLSYDLQDATMRTTGCFTGASQNLLFQLDCQCRPLRVPHTIPVKPEARGVSLCQRRPLPLPFLPFLPLPHTNLQKVRPTVWGTMTVEGCKWQTSPQKLELPCSHKNMRGIMQCQTHVMRRMLN